MPHATIHDFQISQAAATFGAGPLGPVQAAVVTQQSAPQTYFYRPGYEFFRIAGGVIKKLLQFSEVGARFVFGSLADTQKGFIFAFAALPTIIFISSFFTVLYYFGILQFVRAHRRLGHEQADADQRGGDPVGARRTCSWGRRKRR